MNVTSFSAPNLVILVLEISGFLAAAGLNVLCDATRQYRDDGGRLVVVAIPPRIRRLITLARVSGDLDLDPCGRLENPASTLPRSAPSASWACR